MKIYRIRGSNDFQIPQMDTPVYIPGVRDFDCVRKADTWSPPPFYIPNPKLIRSDFFPVGTSGFGCFDTIFGDTTMYTFFEMAGEILPIMIEGRKGCVLNVLNCCNALNPDACDWSIDHRTNERIRIKQYAFHKHRLPHVGLFKIPETSRSEVLVSTDARHYEGDDFYLWYQKKGYKGLKFVELWSDE